MFILTGNKSRDILNLSAPLLQSSNHFISISHSKQLGGYLINPYQSIGLDIEETSRCHFSLYKKIISCDKEQQIEISTLWTLKEASFKSLSILGYQSQLKDIKISENPSCSKTFHMEWKKLKGKGIVFKNHRFTVGLSGLTPAFI